MADTTTTNYGLTKPEVGASEDTWGTKINTNLDTLDTTVDSIQGKSGAATLKHTDSAKLTTTATGIDVTGNATFADNGKAIFGAGSDLQVYHDGSNSYIDEAGQGTLYVRADSATTIANPSNTLSARFRPSTSVSLYYNGVEKLATTATGIDVTGNVTMATGGSIVAGGANDLILNAGESGTPDIYLQSGGGTKVKIEGSNGNVGIGTSIPSSFNAGANNLVIGTGSGSEGMTIYGGGESNIFFADGTAGSSAYVGRIEYSHAVDNMLFYVNNSNAMTIDSSGNLLVGGTSAFGADTITLGTGGFAGIRNTSGSCLELRRDSTDGSIIDFQKDGTTVGSIGNYGGLALDVGKGTTAVLRFRDSLNAIYPAAGIAGGTSDGVTSLGISSGRFNDIYATNGTIQTSDFNEKQDIAELSDAEQRVAVACKGLLRKFRWKDSVAEKGDEARTHFGIIAQDLQAAFAAEGLDAGDYAMFISSTWTDEETNEEKTRMGVRYSELLAFIISAI